MRVFQQGEDIVFCVQDNGVGMTAEQIESIMQRGPHDRTGIGIKNVNDRLKIYFGKQYGLRITSEPDVGTCVEIRMPKIHNMVLCFTEPLPFMAKVANVLLPFGCYYLLMTLSRNCGKMLWILFLFLFFGAFQIVLLYLFGQSIIAVDMFLNLVTTNSSEALELLDNLTPAIIAVIILYVPALILGTISIIRKRKLTVEFIRRERKRAFLVFSPRN